MNFFRKYVRSLDLCLCAIAIALVSAAGAKAHERPITAEEIAAILKENPQMVLDALQAAQEAARERELRQLTATVSPVARSIIEADDNVAWTGAETGAPAVEFFDYNCGFCKRFHNDTALPLLEAGVIKLFLVHTPILGEGSQRMAEFGAAAHLQNRFEAAHAYLIQYQARNVAEADLLIPGLVAAAGLDQERFDRSLADGSARNQVAHNSALARDAGVTGTPTIFMEGEVIAGAASLEKMRQIVAQSNIDP